MTGREWDGKTYDRISGPMENMALPVLGRLELRGDETVIDAGCGSGRVTEQLLARLPGAGSSRSTPRPRCCRRPCAPGRRARRRTSTPTSLEWTSTGAEVDAMLSTATFHWIADQAGLYPTCTAPCGRAPDRRPVRRRGQHRRRPRGGHRQIAADPEIAERLGDYDPWKFLAPDETREHVAAAASRRSRPGCRTGRSRRPAGRTGWRRSTSAAMSSGSATRARRALHHRGPRAPRRRSAEDRLRAPEHRRDGLAGPADG